MNSYDSRVTALDPVPYLGYTTAQVLWVNRDLREEGRCPAIVERGKGRYARFVGKQCVKKAGYGTIHLGWGHCVAHGGAKRLGRATGAWLMAHKFAEELDCTPWDGLLRAVRIAAGKVAYCEWVLGQAASDLELEGRFTRNEDGVILDPDTGGVVGVGQLRDRSWWVAKSELWVDRLARYSKMAIDAGVAQLLVQAELEQGEQIAQILMKTLDALHESDEVGEDAIVAVRSIMRRQLLALESGAGGKEEVIESVVVEK